MIARDGLILIGIGVVLTIILVLAATRYDSKSLFALSLIFGMLAIFTTFFFRDPDRSFDPAEDILIAPADGRVLAVEKISHPFIGEALKVSIFLSILDVHVNRVPATGVVDYVEYNPGKFFAAFQDKASELNEQTEIGMTSDTGHKLVCKQIAGFIARRIVCRLNEGDTVLAGNRFGLIRFGSRTELFVPADSRIEVVAGDHVAGGETVIGYLPEVVGDRLTENNTEGNRAEI